MYLNLLIYNIYCALENLFCLFFAYFFLLKIKYRLMLILFYLNIHNFFHLHTHLYILLFFSLKYYLRLKNKKRRGKGLTKRRRAWNIRRDNGRLFRYCVKIRLHDGRVLRRWLSFTFRHKARRTCGVRQRNRITKKNSQYRQFAFQNEIWKHL